ncbi:MAG: hypothetical protein VST68_08380, partial [Nitrospirota bacterium]|nr:hypothetical protein [Nitrospirota bacterium]
QCRKHQEMTMRGFHTLIIAVVIGVNSGAYSQHPPLLTVPHGDEDTVTLAINLDNPARVIDWPNAFLIYVEHGQACCEGRVPVQGTYHQNEQAVTFQPDFPFAEGTSYRVRVKASLVEDETALPGLRVMHRGQEFLESRFTLPTSQAHPPAKVVQIFPTSNELPANVLRFYVYFSSPMRRGFSDTSVRLVDEEGRDVPKAFMRFKQELWDPHQKRLTIIFDPGRIKRGLSTNMKLQPALQEGKHYRLIIEKNWEDAQGNLLKNQYEKRFLVSPALRSIPDSKRWTLTLPQENSRENFRLHFLRPFDHALLQRMITVRSKAGDSIEGAIEIDQAETRWQFTPKHPWKNGQYTIHVDATLEDVAGNNLQGLFDRPAEEPLTDVVSIELPFVLSKQ